ncbi:MAG: Rap1a/Tai family immunity protein [Pseudomonadota bacterium]
MSRLLIALTIVLFAAAPSFADGNKLLRGCQHMLDAAEGKDVDIAGALSGGFCVGYLQGMADLNIIYSVVLKDKKEIFFCIPEGVSHEQKARVIVKYLRDHPNKLHEHECGLVLDALREAFPCK